MNRRKVLAGSGSVLTAALAGCSGGSTSDRQDGDTDNTDNTDNNESDTGDTGGSDGPKIELLNHEWYNEGQFNAGVRGQVENLTSETLGYVEVSVYFLDSDGVQFSESLANTSDLAGGRVWEFEAMFTGDDPSRVDSYEIEPTVSNY